MNMLKRSCNHTPEIIQVSESRRIVSVTKPKAQRLLLSEEHRDQTYQEVEEEEEHVGEKKLTEVSILLHNLLFNIWLTGQSIASLV